MKNVYVNKLSILLVGILINLGFSANSSAQTEANFSAKSNTKSRSNASTSTQNPAPCIESFTAPTEAQVLAAEEELRKAPTNAKTYFQDARTLEHLQFLDALSSKSSLVDIEKSQLLEIQTRFARLLNDARTQIPIIKYKVERLDKRVDAAFYEKYDRNGQSRGLIFHQRYQEAFQDYVNARQSQIQHERRIKAMEKVLEYIDHALVAFQI